MRFLIQISAVKTPCEIPINYQYPLSAWIYKTLNAANSEFATQLHEQGVAILNRSFKLFTFSRLRFEKSENSGNILKIHNSEGNLIINFVLDKANQHFIEGIFNKQQFTIANTQCKADFIITQVQCLPEPTFSSQMKFKTLSPICITKQRENNKNALFVPPDNSNYSELFMHNLLHKYMALHQHQNSQKTEEYCKTIEQIQQQQPHIKLLNKEKSRLITIKEGNKEETKIRGFDFNFEITAPPALLKLGYYAGFGEKNSLGFGCCEIIN